MGDMKARMTIAFLAAVCAAAGLSAAGTAAHAEEGASLFLPSSYEQYLPLRAPSDVAMNENYIAVADGSDLFVYDRAEGAYSRYRHEKAGEGRSISKLQFSESGDLYFSDQDAQLFRYELSDGSAEIQSDVPCSTFLISGSTLYTAVVTLSGTALYAVPMTGPLSLDAATTIDRTTLAKTPCLFLDEGTFCCAVDYNVRAYERSGDSYSRRVLLLAGEEDVQGLTSVASYRGELYYTVSGASDKEKDGLYRTRLDDGSELLLADEGMSALSVWGDRLFCVRGASVREIAVGEDSASYTSYELAAASDSPNRLSGAEETVRSRELVVSSDRGNGRVSVYDGASKTFSVLPTGAADHVATDGRTVAVSVGNSVHVYDFEQYLAAERAREKDPSAPAYEPYIHPTANAVTGLAVLFGRCYYVTEHHYGVAEEGAVEFTRSNAPTALAADVWGDLYVADARNGVLRFTEEEFLDPAAVGETVSDGWQLPERYSSFRADFEGNIYYLSDGALWRNGERLSPLSAGNAVYRPEGGASAPVSFALGFETSELALQFGDFMLLDRTVSLPNLSQIPALNVYSQLGADPADRELFSAEVRAGATGISVDLAALNEGSASFPYLGYERTQSGGKGVLLAEAGKYDLVALYENYAYTVALFRSEDCSVAALARTEVPAAARYTASEVALSSYPCLAPALTLARLPRGTEVTVIAQMTAQKGEGFDFALVRTASGYGFVPLPYLVSFPPELPEAAHYSFGYLKANPDGVRFHSEEGDLVVTERTRVRVYETADKGVYRVVFGRDGTEYYAEVTSGMLDSGNGNAIRTGIIIILAVVAVGIVAAYILLRPRKKSS